MPFPRKALERAALAAQLIKVAADIFDRRNAGFEQRAVRRIPFREILDRLAAGRFLVFREQIFDLRAVAMRPKRGRQRMIDASGVDADELDALFDQPLRGVLAQARRIAEIFLAVGIFAMPAGVDEDDIAGLDLQAWRAPDRTARSGPISFWQATARRRCRKTVCSSRSPTAGAPGTRWIGAFTMRRSMKDRGDLVRHHALLGMMGDAFELDLLVAREDRRIHAPAMAELVKLEPAHGIDTAGISHPSPNATTRRLSIVNCYRNFGCLYHGPIRRDNSGAPRRRALATMRKKAHVCIELPQYSAAKFKGRKCHA